MGIYNSRKQRIGTQYTTDPQLQWSRPSDWLALTPPTASEQKFVGLLAVFNQGSNYVALRATVSSGTYTVDWGDGTAAQTYASNTTAQYNYTYSSINSNTLTSRGYRQAIVTVTPTTSGATFSFFGLNYRHSAVSSISSSGPWLDVAISAPNATNTYLGGFDTSPTQTLIMAYLERARIIAHNATNLAYLFRLCRALQSVEIANSNSNVTNVQDMFYECQNLRVAPLFNTASVTNMQGMFFRCYNLEEVPPYNTSSATTMNGMFNQCTSLTTVPWFNTTNVTNMTDMFRSCRSLTTVPLFNTAAVTTMGGMFAETRSLQTVPLFNTQNVTNMSSMFDPSTISSVPLFNTANVTNMFAMFYGCGNLLEIPFFNTAKVTNMGAMFAGCISLRTCPLFNTANVTSMGSMFDACYSLNEIPSFNMQSVTTTSNMFWDGVSLKSFSASNTANITNMTNMFFNDTALTQIVELNMGGVSSASNNNINATSCSSLSKAKLTNMRWSLSISSRLFAAAELNELYTSLATLNPSVTTVSGNGTTVTYTVSDITAFVSGRTVTITGVNPSAYNLTNVTVGTVNTVNKTFTVTNAATGTYVSGGTAAIQDNRTLTVTGNPGLTGDDPTIATNKGWTVTEV